MQTEHFSYASTTSIASLARPVLGVASIVLVLWLPASSHGDFDFQFVVLGADAAEILPGNVIQGFFGGDLTYLIRARTTDGPGGEFLGGELLVTGQNLNMIGLEPPESIVGHECLTSTGMTCDNGTVGTGGDLLLPLTNSPMPFMQVGRIELAQAPYGYGDDVDQIWPFGVLSWVQNGTQHSATVLDSADDILEFAIKEVGGTSVQINLTSAIVSPSMADLTIPVAGVASATFPVPLVGQFTVGLETPFETPQTGTVRVAMNVDNFTHADLLYLDIPGSWTQAVDADLAALGNFNWMYSFDAAYVDQFTIFFDNQAIDQPVHQLAVSTLPSLITDPGDFNGDGYWDATDLDALATAIIAGGDSEFDLNGDGVISAADATDPVSGWLALGGAKNVSVTNGNPFLVGDANLDGVVDGADYVAWNASKYDGATLQWSKGDFNFDSVADELDFGIWNANRFSQSRIIPVPEPTNRILPWCLAVGICSRRLVIREVCF